MFSRLCKNAIYPLNTTRANREPSTAATSSSEPAENQSSPPPRPPPLLPRRIAPGGRQNPNDSIFDQTEFTRREPPPPYWLHHHHQRISVTRPQQTSLPAPSQSAAPAAPSPIDYRNTINNSLASQNVTEAHSDSDNEHQEQHTQNVERDVYRPDLLYQCSSQSTGNPRSQSPTGAVFPNDDNVNHEVLHQNLSLLQLTNTQNDNPFIHDDPELLVEPINSPEHNIARSASAAVVEERASPSHQQDMGQSLSQRRPRLSLTWVLRDQQQPAQPLPPPPNQPNLQTQPRHLCQQNPITLSAAALDGNHQPVDKTSAVYLLNGNQQQHHQTTLDKKKFRSKSKDCERLFSERYASDDRGPKAQMPPTGGRLMFVCSRTRDVTSCLGYDSDCDYGEVTSSQHQQHQQHSLGSRRSRRSSDKVKRAASKLSFRDNLNNNSLQEKPIVCEKMGGAFKELNAGEALLHFGGMPSAADDAMAKGIKSTYSEPSLCTGGVVGCGQSRKHRHRRRRERNRSQRFGYEIKNVDDFLSKCSLSSPGNIPVVLSSSSTLYQTRPGGYQIEVPLPLGMVVNAVFKNQNWLYVQTPHAEEGYVGYATCLPLGILPQARPTATSKPPPCWESNGDVFPKPCGNMTDSEKEIQMRSGTRSEGARTPRLRRISNQPKVAHHDNGANIYNGAVSTKSGCDERHLDVLYLRATSHSKIADKTYAQLKPLGTKGYANKLATSDVANSVITTQPTSGTLTIVPDYAQCAPNASTTDDYVLLQHRRPLQPIYQSATSAATMSVVSNQSVGGISQVGATANRALLRQTLLAVTENFTSTSIAVKKGDVVTLLACRQVLDPRRMMPVQWFFVRARDGAQGYIPAEVAGHGFL